MEFGLYTVLVDDLMVTMSNFESRSHVFDSPIQFEDFPNHSKYIWNGTLNGPELRIKCPGWGLMTGSGSKCKWSNAVQMLADSIHTGPIPLKYCWRAVKFQYY